MKKTFRIMLNEIGVSLRRKTFVMFAFGIPLVMAVIALVFMLINRNPSASIPTVVEHPAMVQPTHEGYVDAGGLIVTMPEDVPADWLIAYPSAEAAQAALDSGDIAGYYIISPDYVRTGAITYVTLTHNPISDDVRVDGLEWILLVNLLGGDEALAADIRQPLDVEVTALTPPQETANDDSWIANLFPTLMVLILYMVILMPAGALVNAMTDEKKNRIIEVLMSSVSPLQLITGKIIALGLLGLVQTAMWVGVLWMTVAFGGRPLGIPENFDAPANLVLWTFIYFLSGYAMYSSLMAAVGAIANEAKETRSATFFVMGPVIVAYMFMIVIFDNPNGLISVALSLFPLTAPVAMIARMAVMEVPIWQATLSAVLQFLTAILFVRTTARMFRAHVLLSGQPFTVGGYYKTLLGRV